MNLSEVSEESRDLARRFLDAARELGADGSLVRGSGGNLSMKDGGDLWVKASGTRIGEADPNDYVRLSISEAFPAALTTGRSSSSSGRRPSIEWGLHATTPRRFVFHLHSAATCAVSILASGAAVTRSVLGPPASFVPYESPGFDLTSAVLKASSGRNLSPELPVEVSVLGNHGLVIAGDSPEECLAGVRHVEREFGDFLMAARGEPSVVATANSESRPVPKGWSVRDDLGVLAAHPLGIRTLSNPAFPDQAVFLPSSATTIGIFSSEASAVIMPSWKALCVSDSISPDALDWLEFLAIVVSSLPEDARIVGLPVSETMMLGEREDERLRKAMAAQRVASGMGRR